MKKQNPSLWYATSHRFVWILCRLKLADQIIRQGLAAVLFGLLWIGTASDTIAQDLPVISVTPDAATAVEGSTDASFTLSADPAPTKELVVNIITIEGEGNFTAIGTSGDFSTVTFNSGESSVTYTVTLIDDDTDEPSDRLDVLIALGPPESYNASSNTSVFISLLDDDPTIVTLNRTGGSSTVSEGENVEFTVTLGRALVTDEIIDVPLIISGTGVTTTDWSLATKTNNGLNTGITLVNETTNTPVVRFAGINAETVQTATLLLTPLVDGVMDTETFTVALGPDNTSANGFDLESRMTNVGGGADPNAEAANNTFNVTINDTAVPIFTSDAMIKAAEGATTLPNIKATHADGDKITYSISGGADSVQFRINQNSGALTFKTAPDFEAPSSADKNNVYEVEVTVSDGTYNTRQTLTVTVTDVNEPPVITSPATASVAENTTTVLTITATDEDAGTTLTYAITAGADSAQFSIDQSSGALAFKTAPDFESASADGDDDYEVIVTVSDGINSAAQTITVTVTDVNEAPFIAAQTFSIIENAAAGTTVGTVVATDEDAGDNLTFAITAGDTSNAFAINENTGVITVAGTIDHETTLTYTLTVQVSDGDLSANAAVTINVTNVNDNDPMITSPATVNVVEGTTSVLTVTATDADAGTTLTYSIGGGADRALFRINRTSGALNFATAPDFEAPRSADNDNVYEVIVTASDGTNSATQSITVTVTNDPSDDILGFSQAEETIIFPNPSGRYLEVRSSVENAFKILSLSGKILLKGTVNTRVDITSLRSGLYLVQLSDGRLLKFVRE